MASTKPGAIQSGNFERTEVRDEQEGNAKLFAGIPGGSDQAGA